MSSTENSTSPLSTPVSEPRSTEGLPETNAPSKASPVNSQPEARSNLALTLAALGLALIGQFYFSHVRDNFLDGVGFFVGAIIVFLILIRREEMSPGIGSQIISLARRIRDQIRDHPLKSVLVALSFGLAYTTIRLLRAKPGPGSYWDVFILWVISFLVYAAAFVHFPRIDLREWFKTNQQEVITVVVLTFIAGLLRFVALGSVPNIISGDEGVLGALAVKVLNGELNNMMATVYGNSSLFLFIMAGNMKLFGVNETSLRLLSAISGTLTIPAVYLIARRLLNQRVALIASSIMAVSHFHLHFSRIIVATSIQDALFATLTFYFFLTGLKQRSTWKLVLSALIIGFELYIYMGSRLVIMLLPIYVISLLITDKKLVKDNLGNLLAFVGALLVISAPMILWGVDHPDEFMARANQLGVIQSGWLANEAANTGKSQVHIFLDLFRQAFLTVNYYPSYAFHYSKLPMLDFVTGSVFILGLAYSLYRVKDPRYLLLNGWFWSGVLVGGAMVVVPGISAYRIMLIFPAVCLFIAVAWDKLMTNVKRAIPTNKIARTAPTALFIAIFSVLNLKAYFVDYAPTCEYEGTNTRLASYIGSYIGDLGPEYEPYLVTAPREIFGIYRSIDFLSGNIPTNNIKEQLTGPPTFINADTKAVFFFTPQREGELEHVRNYFPGGTVDRVYDCEELLMIVYVTPGE